MYGVSFVCTERAPSKTQQWPSRLKPFDQSSGGSRHGVPLFEPGPTSRGLDCYGIASRLGSLSCEVLYGLRPLSHFVKSVMAATELLYCSGRQEDTRMGHRFHQRTLGDVEGRSTTIFHKYVEPWLVWKWNGNSLQSLSFCAPHKLRTTSNTDCVQYFVFETLGFVCGRSNAVPLIVSAFCWQRAVQMHAQSNHLWLFCQPFRVLPVHWWLIARSSVD